MVQWSGKEETMETNCLLYMPKSKKLVAGYVDDEGFVYLLMPGHRDGWNVPLSEAFMNAFNVSIYPG